MLVREGGPRIDSGYGRRCGVELVQGSTYEFRLFYISGKFKKARIEIITIWILQRFTLDNFVFKTRAEFNCLRCWSIMSRKQSLVHLPPICVNRSLVANVICYGLNVTHNGLT